MLNSLFFKPKKLEKDFNKAKIECYNFLKKLKFSSKNNSKNVIEGIVTTKSIMDISQSQNVELPLAASVFEILFNNMSPLEGVKSLMKREQTSEIY